MFDFRYNVLRDFVDYFIICESIFDHRGKPKKKNFIKKDNYDDKKVKYFLLEEPFPENTSIWQNQAIQREFLLKSADFADEEDFIFFSDPDEIPLNEVVFDFNDRLKSMTSGYASFDYEIIGHKEGDLVKMGILVNSEPVDALAMMVHKDFAQSIGRDVCEKLKDLIPRHNFMIPIQAAIGGKIIARETIKGFKKDVLTKIHGGGARDRKRKLLDKQKKGKAKSKQFGRVEIPQEAFIGVLKINKDI